MIIALFPNDEKRDSYEIALEIKKFFESKGIKVVAEDEDAKKLSVLPISTIDPKKIDFLIGLGGDGTILRLSHKYRDLDAAILGINLGSLGFMADIPLEDLKEALENLIKGSYSIEKRMMVEGQYKSHKCFAANDIVVHRGKNYSLIDLEIEVNNLYVNSFVADGIIISTPNGSTAYSLAAGGPILSPEIEALVITPISPHTISNRPIVVSSSSQIRITNLSSLEYPIEVYADGISHFNLEAQKSFVVQKSKHTFNLVKFSKYNFFDTLRSKLDWVGKSRISAGDDNMQPGRTAQDI